MCDRRVVRSYAFRSLGFDPNAIKRNPKKLRYTTADTSSVRPDLWGRENECRVHIGHGIARGLDAFQRFGEENGGVGAFPLRVGRGKQRPNVGSGDSPEQRVGRGVKKNIAIGVATQALRVR